ncbi:unnamed protein product [Urochloa humidicola]
MLREAMSQHWNLPDEEQWYSLQPEVLLERIHGLGLDDGAKLLLLLWRIWQVRNNITHEAEKLSITASVKFLLKYWSELCDIRQSRGKSDPHGKRPAAVSLVVGKKETPQGGKPQVMDGLKLILMVHLIVSQAVEALA